MAVLPNASLGNGTQDLIFCAGKTSETPTPETTLEETKIQTGKTMEAIHLNSMPGALHPESPGLATARTSLEASKEKSTYLELF